MADADEAVSLARELLEGYKAVMASYSQLLVLQSETEEKLKEHAREANRLRAVLFKAAGF